MFEVFEITYFEAIFYSILLIFGSYAIGYLYGSILSLKDGFKSLDYDNVVRENKELKRSIEIVNSNRSYRKH